MFTIPMVCKLIEVLVCCSYVYQILDNFFCYTSKYNRNFEKPASGISKSLHVLDILVKFNKSIYLE